MQAVMAVSSGRASPKFGRFPGRLRQMRRRIAVALRSIRVSAYIAMSVANVIALPTMPAMIRARKPRGDPQVANWRADLDVEAEPIGPLRALVA
jgi:hypothetical protein